ncbi:hypothetical protein OEZ86_010942 [Tetradesmus obliquus]|nr:hypothetical protein OEZ86_010942 [Tetradesmus obliquus]
MDSPGSVRDIEAALSVDEQFHKTVVAIEKRLQLLGRLPQVRIKAWLTKLKQSTSNITWKRNRNLYARLLLEQLRAGCLEVPFSTLPPEGALPTLPAYLTYRFMSPPKQRMSGSPGSPPRRPHSAGAGLDASAIFRNMSAPGDAHAAWSVPSSGNAFPAPGQLSALSPIRCNPPRQGKFPGELQQQWPAADADGGCRRYGGKARSPGDAAAACSAGPASCGSPGGRGVQRPGSPGAVGLLNAAAALAAELEGDKVDAALLESRMRFAEDKLLQQEAELVRLQGQAVAARRRVKSVTAATLGELVERYGSAAAGWDSPTAQGAGSRQPGYAESVYGPMWQLLSSIQEVLSMPLSASPRLSSFAAASAGLGSSSLGAGSSGGGSLAAISSKLNALGQRWGAAGSSSVRL